MARAAGRSTARSRVTDTGSELRVTYSSSDVASLPEEKELRTEVSNSALVFEGNDYVDCGNGIDLVHKSFTIEFWAKRGDTGRSQAFLRQSENRRPTRNHGLHMGFRTNNQYCIAFWGDNLDTQTPYTDRDWHHWAGTYDHQTKRQRLYCDSEPAVEPRTATDDCLATGPFLIGSGYNPQNMFKGTMAEVRIWDHVRGEAELKADMHRRLTGHEPGLVAYWPLNEGTGDTVSDKSGNGHHGTIHDATWQDDATSALFKG